jgi:tRNA (cmo5U34)-methyltransferase
MAAQPKRQWDENDSETFVKYSDAFVPHRGEQYQAVCTLVAAFAPERAIDLCCGAGHLSRALLESLSTVRVEGLDASEKMLQRARASLKQYGDRFRAASFDVHDRAWRRRLTSVDVVVSSLALHHLNGDEKRIFYRDLFEALAPGGVFVNADLILPATSAGLAVAADAWDRSVREYAHRNHDQRDAFNAFESLRWNLFRYPDENATDHPLPIVQELALMTDAGFSNVDIHWMYAGHAIWGGCKV